MTTGITIASMMPVALNRICRSATAMGPFGSSTPSVQPPSSEAPVRTKASKPYRILDLPRAELDKAASAASGAGQGIDVDPSDVAVSARARYPRIQTAAVIDRERRKQREQIEDGRQEQPVSVATIGSSAFVQLKCEQEEKSTADCGDRAIDRACKPELPGQLRSENKQAAVDQDLPRRCSPSRDDRQHGDAGTGIIIAAIERESPEMGWCPKEDDEEQRKRLEPDLSGRRGPSDHGRQCAGCTADDDVLGRGPLQPRRVHYYIEEDRAGQQRGCCEVRCQSESCDCDNGKDQSEGKCLNLRDLAAGNRPHRGASHDCVDIGVVPHVQGAGGSGASCDRENCNKTRKWIEACRCDHQPDERCEQRERHNARLHQCGEVG